MTVEDLDRDMILAFLDELEQKRKNTVQTRNARLGAIRSFFHHVAANDPAALGVAQRVLAIPIKKSHTEITHHLSRSELDALIAAPDQRTSLGRRDRTLLLFLARTGARVSEALGVDTCDLQLEQPRPQVLLRGKGRKERIVPVAHDLVKALQALMRERGIDRKRSLTTRPRPFGFMKYSAGRRSAEDQHVGDGARVILAGACGGVAGKRADAESLRCGAWDRPLGIGAVVAPIGRGGRFERSWSWG